MNPKTLFLALVLCGVSNAADAAVLCSNPSGSVFVRDTCKPNEQQLDLAALGLTGPAGPAGPQGPQGLQGPAGIAGYELVAHQEFLASAPYIQNVHVECPAGKKVLGGGFDIETPTDVKVFGSESSDGHGNFIDHGWTLVVENNSGLVRQATVSAVCAFVQ